VGVFNLLLILIGWYREICLLESSLLFVKSDGEM
jgi:hypothetical protein